MSLSPDLQVLKALSGHSYIFVTNLLSTRASKGPGVSLISGIQPRLENPELKKIIWDLHRRGLIARKRLKTTGRYQKTATTYALAPKGKALLKELGL